MQINPAIFRAYDIRGLYPKDLNVDVARVIGRAFSAFISRKFLTARPIVLVGRDLRFSSEELRRALIEGIIGSGGDVIDLGVVTTPQAIYTIAGHKKAHAGVMVTASHNPVHYNGFKLFLRGAHEVGLHNGLSQVLRLAQKKATDVPRHIGQIYSGAKDADSYIHRLHRLVPALPALRILIDAAGGATGTILARVLAPYHIFYKPIFFEPDPHFRHHHPNPLDVAVRRLIGREMTKSRFDLGVAFDGDGDRAIFFDETGEEIRTDHVFAVLAAHELQKKQKQTFVFELTHPRYLAPFIEAYGGALIDSKVGGIFVRGMMQKTKAALGGELSGHIYHRELLNTDSGIYTLLRLLKVLGSASRPLSEIIRAFAHSAFAQVAIAHKFPQEALERVTKQYRPHISSRLDGMTVHYPDWWFNIRVSNTEPLVRLTIEAENAVLLREHERDIRAIIG